MNKSNNNVQNTTNILCKLIGHAWLYKDYSNWMTVNGSEYPFKASRNCSRCNQFQYLFNDWQVATQKSPLDLERDSQAVKQLEQFQTQ